jgi:hypothetical protein
VMRLDRRQLRPRCLGRAAETKVIPGMEAAFRLLWGLLKEVIRLIRRHHCFGSMTTLFEFGIGPPAINILRTAERM